MPAKNDIPKILFVEHEANSFLLSRIPLARELHKLGFDVHVAVPHESELQNISRQNVTVHSYFLNRMGSNLMDELRCFFSLLRLYRKLCPKLIHHFGLKPVLYGGFASQAAKIPSVVNTLNGLGYLVSENTLKSRIIKTFIKIGLKYSFLHPNHCTILQNTDDYNYLLSERLTKIKNIILIRGSGVDISRFTHQPEPNGIPVIIMIARMLWAKGVGEFVTVARNLKSRKITARFVLVGEVEVIHPSAVPLSTLRNWCANGDIEWLGWQEEIPHLIAQSHIVCLPSYYGEGIPRVLLEAAASGRVIVTTDSPGCREVVQDGDNGILIPVRNHRSLEDAIVQLIKKSSLRATMGKRGRKIATDNFSMEKIISETISVYNSLANN